ncbi:MAG: beta strand repeat-containing protein, partial [Devosia sp.]
ALVSATAVGLLMATGAAYAGDDNDALTLQSGNSNVAGTDQSSAHNSNIGAPGLPATQMGNNNYLSATQVAGHNSAGAAGPGIDQQNNYNNIYIYQGYGDTSTWDPYNTIGSIKQDGYIGGSTPNGSGWANQATIYQFYSDNVGTVTQHYTGGNPNTIWINETGGSGSTGNNINSISQNGGNNAVTMTLTNLSGGGANGDGSFTTDGIADVVANPHYYDSYVSPPWPVIGQATVTQNGSGNTVGFNISGNDNKFGFYQNGSSGSRQINGGITSGNWDEIAAVQEGTSDLLNAYVSGYGNQVGSIQLGASGNTGTASISGSFNRSLLLQDGTGGSNTGEVDTGATSGGSGAGNNLGVIQYATGGSNQATVNVQTGGSNTAVVGQYSSGGTNSASVVINGSNNNLLSGITPSHFASGHSAAANVASPVTIGTVANALGGSGVLNSIFGSTIGGALGSTPLLTPGLMTQVADLGGSNSLTLGVSSSNNLFSTTQGTIGSGSNTLNATIEGGNGNELSVAQLTGLGGTNLATTVQNGWGNSIGLTQIGTNTASISQ